MNFGEVNKAQAPIQVMPNLSTLFRGETVPLVYGHDERPAAIDDRPEQVQILIGDGVASVYD